MAKRASLLNGLNCSLPQMIDRIDKDGDEEVFTPGLWNSLNSILGVGSFDHSNKDKCWEAFHASRSIFATDHRKEIDVLKSRHRSILEALG